MDSSTLDPYSQQVLAYFLVWICFTMHCEDVSLNKSVDEFANVGANGKHEYFVQTWDVTSMQTSTFFLRAVYTT